MSEDIFSIDCSTYEDDEFEIPSDPIAEESILSPPAQGQKKTIPKLSRKDQIKGILDRVRSEVKDDDAFLDAWKDVVHDTHVMFDNNPKPMSEVIKYVLSVMKLPEDPTVLDVRRKEVVIGNLLQTITLQLAFAEAGSKMFSERKKDLLARAKNKKVSQAVIEAELATGDDEFRMTRGIWLSAEINYRFWITMRTICTDTLDRLQQIYNTLAAEARIRQ